MKKLFIIISFLILFALVSIAPPDNFLPTNIYIKAGDNLRSVSATLKENNIIRSRALFETFVILFGGEKNILPGEYVFDKNMSSLQVAYIFSNGGRMLRPVKVTVPEGFDVNDIAQLFDARLKSFDKNKFLQIAKDQDYEGYLFPDTYFFFTTDNESDVIEYMRKNFDKKVSTLSSEIVASGKTEREIIIMASIIEREADGDLDREMISGILWKRMNIGMPLQADAAPVTYDRKGLPESPIANPGLASIRAAIYPKDSPYLYYIHDREGNIYYARNFDEHRQNIRKYLR